VLAQELAAVEGLARVDVVCFDKTGTLTDGKIEFDRASFFDESQTAKCHSALATFAADPNANATASALGAQFSTGVLTPTTRLEFSSARKWSAFETETETWILGAPEFVIQSQPDTLREAQLAAATGQRVLALARTSNKLNNDELPAGIEPMALLHFTEQLRSDAQETLAFFAAQEVEIYIISGDSPNTVAHTASRAGLQDVGEPIDASAFREDPAGLLNAIRNGRVIGRVHPEQKKLIIEHLQSLGHVVAMIGDGVNDCLALKQADLGIAMGSGASATKAVANLVILDEKFSSIPLVLAEGRRVVANIERVSKLFLTKTVWALAISITFGVLLWSFPYLPRQLTALDAFAIGIPAFLLALLPSQARHRPGFLNRALRSAIPAGIFTAAGLIALTMVIRSDSTWTLEQTHTATVLLLSITSLWVLALQSGPFNPTRGAIFVGMMALCAVLFTMPFVRAFFGLVSLTNPQLLLILGIGLAANLAISVTAKALNLTHS
jgi:cation-transporting ATPase E